METSSLHRSKVSAFVVPGDNHSGEVIDPYSEHRVGDGKKPIPLWLDDVPIMATGFDEWPNVGELYVIAGESWRVEKITNCVHCEIEPSCVD